MIDGSVLFDVLDLRVRPAGTSMGLASRAPPPISCNLSVTDPPNPFAWSCTLLQDVCLDQVGFVLLSKHRPAAILPVLSLQALCGGLACSCPVAAMLTTACCVVALDPQGRIILYDKKHRPRRGNGPPVDVPELAPDGRQKAFYLRYWNQVRGTSCHAGRAGAPVQHLRPGRPGCASTRRPSSASLTGWCCCRLLPPQTNADQKFGLPPVPVRVASRDEPRAYLAQPAFSTCTLPVLFYQHNSFNFAHTLRDNAALFFSALRESGGLAPHIKVVLQTGGGLPVTPMNRALWEPLTNLTVESLADASVRLPDEQVTTLRRLVRAGMGRSPLPSPGADAAGLPWTDCSLLCKVKRHAGPRFGHLVCLSRALRRSGGPAAACPRCPPPTRAPSSAASPPCLCACTT